MYQPIPPYLKDTSASTNNSSNSGGSNTITNINSERVSSKGRMFLIWLDVNLDNQANYQLDGWLGGAWIKIHSFFYYLVEPFYESNAHEPHNLNNS